MVERSVRERYSVVTTGATKKSAMRSVAGSRNRSGAEYLLTGWRGSRRLAAWPSRRLLDGHLIAQGPLHLSGDHVHRLLRRGVPRLDRRDAAEERILPLREIGMRRLEGGVSEEIADLLQEPVVDQRYRAIQDRQVSAADRVLGVQIRRHGVGEQTDGYVLILGRGRDHVGLRVRQSDRFATLHVGWMGRVAEVVEEPGLAPPRGDPLLRPLGPVPGAPRPEQDLAVAVGDGLVEAVPVVVDPVSLDDPGVDPGPQPAVVAQRRGLVEDQLAGLGIIVAPAERAVPLHEVRTIERPVIVALAGLDDVLLPRVFGDRHHVIPGEGAARDALGE